MKRKRLKCIPCDVAGKLEENCGICKGTGMDQRTWYMLVGWDENCYHGYSKSTSDWNQVQVFRVEGMELYGCAESLGGIQKLQHEFYDKGGWFYR